MLDDTSVLLRTLQLQHPQLPTVRGAIKLLTAQGRDLHVLPQNLAELWVVATRPTEYNGLGMTPAAAAIELVRLKSIFLLLPETPAIFPSGKAWLRNIKFQGSPLMTRDLWL